MCGWREDFRRKEAGQDDQAHLRVQWKVARFTIAKKRYVIRCTKSMQVRRIVVEGPNAIVTYVLTRARKR